MFYFFPDGQTDNTFISYEDVEKLRVATNQKKLEKFLKSFYDSNQSIIGETINPAVKEYAMEERVQMLSSIRLSFIEAIKLRELIQSNNISIERMKEQDLNIENYIGNGPYASLNISLFLKITGLNYESFIKNSLKNQKRRNSEYHIKIPVQSEFKNNLLTISGMCRDTSEDMKKCCADILDTLSAIHLYDMFVETKEGIPHWRSNYNTSLLWYHMCDFFQKGNIVRCKGCNLPIPISPKAGKKREYCDDACRKKAERNKRKMSGNNEYFLF